MTKSKKLKIQPNKSVYALRKLLKLSRKDFAIRIRVSVHLVISIELGRARLTPQIAQRIRAATGADIASLLAGNGIVLDPVGKGHYTDQSYKYWTSRFGISSKEEAQDQFERASDALWLILHAAAKSGTGKLKNRLPAVWMSFIEWAEATRRDSRLENEIDALLAERKFKDTLTMTYGDWRNDKATDGHFSTYYGFKDDKRQPDDKKHTITVEARPCWTGPFGNMQRADVSHEMHLTPPAPLPPKA